MTLGRAEFFSFRERDLDGAKAAVGQDFFTTSMDLVDRTASYDFRFDGVVLGALAVGVSQINSGLEIGTADLEDCYYVNYSASGSMHARHRRRAVEVTPGWGAVYHPVGPVAMTTSDEYGSYAVRIDRRAVNAALEEQLGHPVPPDPVLEPHVDLRTGPGRRWDRLVRLLCDEARTTPSALSHPMIAAPLHDAVVTGFVHATEHRWRDALGHPSQCWSRTPVRRAVEAMRNDPAQPFTPNGLARLAARRPAPCTTASAAISTRRRWPTCGSSGSSAPTPSSAPRTRAGRPWRRSRTAGGSPTSAGSPRPIAGPTAAPRGRRCGEPDQTCVAERSGIAAGGSPMVRRPRYLFERSPSFPVGSPTPRA